MATEDTIHQFNLSIFESYLKDVRTGTTSSMISLAFLTVISFQVVDITMLTLWFSLVFMTAAIKFFSYKFFNPDIDATSLAKFESWHHLLQALSGLAWGSACFFLLKSGDLSGNESLVLNMLCVLIAYSAVVMSASSTGMLTFVTPIISCMLIYFATDLTHYHWWFVATLLLAGASAIFGKINKKHVLSQVENELLNKRYIDELNRVKASVQRANLDLVKKNEALVIAQERLRMLATNDELTQVFNRRHAMTYLEKVFAELRRRPDDFVLVLADIDHFKSINDRYGHPAGDLVLRGFSKMLKEQLRQVDTVARFGGEEFLIMLPKTKELEAKAIIQRLCDAVAAQPYKLQGHSVKVTSSFGLAYYQVGDTIEKLIERADQALYHAKKSGRNNVKTYDEADMAAYIAAV